MQRFCYLELLLVYERTINIVKFDASVRKSRTFNEIKYSRQNKNGRIISRSERNTHTLKI